VKKKHGIIIETPTEARQAEPGPSILLMLVASVGIAITAMGIVWFLFLVLSFVSRKGTLGRSCDWRASQLTLPRCSALAIRSGATKYSIGVNIAPTQ
jgi:hypothetical protein